MNLSDFLEVLPDPNEAAFFERERESFKRNYRDECEFYGAIEAGNPELVKELWQKMMNEGIASGMLSRDSLRQMKYWGVASITLGTRSSIRGGVDEVTAYTLSDCAILRLDDAQSVAEIGAILYEQSVKIAAMVRQCKPTANYPAAIKKCMQYVRLHLNKKITVADIADECGYSPDYLSSLFSKTTGKTISHYIRREKIIAACQLLQAGKSTAETAYCLDFSSESYFIKSFRDEMGITPARYIASI